MTTELTHTVQRGVDLVIPLNKLKASPRNARKTPHAAGDIEALAASITVKGVLQPPVVETERRADGTPSGCYLVTIGEGRRQALRLLAERKVIAKTAPVRCTLDDENDPFEVSLDENVTRAAMHPADQFEAFRDLAEQRGWSAEEIAARFGVTAHVVRQRLRLGAVSPRLMAAYRQGDLTLEQLMAFAVSEDHARQEQVCEQLSYNRSPYYIRQLMTEHEVPARDRRASFVGPEPYEAAGGRIRRDLFTEDGGGWFEDLSLLERLAVEKLQTEADRILAEEGWRWAEAHLDYPQAHGLRRLYPSLPVHDEATQARLDTLASEYDALVVGEDEDDLPLETVARLDEIDAELQAASETIYSGDQRQIAGVFVVLDWEGRLRIERGFVRSEDETQAEGQAPDRAAPDGADAEPGAPDGPEDGSKPLSDRLIADLSAHRTAALRDTLAGMPVVAFAAALHALVLQTFYRGRSRTCLELTTASAALAPHAEGFADSIAARSLEERHAYWTARLPKEPAETWEAILRLSDEDRLGLFAYCVALSVNTLQLFGQGPVGMGHAEALAAHVALDMSVYWRATAQSYFGRVTKAHILTAVRDAKSEADAARLSGLKKDAMASAAADLLGADPWLPPLLRTAAAGPA